VLERPVAGAAVQPDAAQEPFGLGGLLDLPGPQESLDRVAQDRIVELDVVDAGTRVREQQVRPLLVVGRPELERRLESSGRPRGTRRARAPGLPRRERRAAPGPRARPMPRRPWRA
jgi:hypothetical protein